MKKRMLKILGLTMAVFTLTTSTVVLAEKQLAPAYHVGSRVPAGLVPTVDAGIEVEPAYEYVSRNARYIWEKVALKGNVSTVQHEINKGSHYYVFSPLYSPVYGPRYGEAYTRVKLPTSINRGWNASQNKALRNGFISLGIFGTGNYGIDMGIMYTDAGWRPYVYDSAKKYDGGNGGFYLFDDKYNITPSDGAVEAVIVATPVSNTKVRLYVQFKNRNGEDIYTDDRIFYQEITVKANNISVENGIPTCFFYRFASLVNIDDNVDDQNDGTYMLGGKFEGLGLYNITTTQYDDWGISTGLVERAWKVTPECTSVTWTSNSDTFNIHHTGAVPQP